MSDRTRAASVLLLTFFFISGCFAFFDGGNYVVQDELEALDRVVVCRDCEVNEAWVGVGVGDGDDWNAKLLGFANGVDIFEDVSHKDDTWLAVKILDATVLLVEIVDFLLEALDLEFVIAVCKLT